MTLGQVVMISYDSNSPMYNQESNKCEAAVFSPLTLNGGDESRSEGNPEVCMNIVSLCWGTLREVPVGKNPKGRWATVGHTI